MTDETATPSPRRRSRAKAAADADPAVGAASAPPESTGVGDVVDRAMASGSILEGRADTCKRGGFSDGVLITAAWESTRLTGREAYKALHTPPRVIPGRAPGSA